MLREILEPAWVLAERRNHQESYLRILHGLWVHFLAVGNLAESVRWAERMLDTARRYGRSDLEINAHRSFLASHFWLGDLHEADSHGKIVAETYKAAKPSPYCG